MNKRLAAKLKSAGEKAVKQGHPWVWQNSIDKITEGGSCGDSVIIFDKRKNKFLAFGLYDPKSPIRIKVLQINQPMVLDRDWIHDKLRVALALRQSLLDTDTNSFRWIYGENDSLPGLIIDIYDNVCVIKLYSLIWKNLLDDIIEVITELYAVKAIVLRLSRNVTSQIAPSDIHQNGSVIWGKLNDPEVIFTEYGLRFSANVIDGHKTGYFLDHRHNRKQVGDLSKGKKVLDVFSYAGGFSVHALAGGAKSVLSLDISKQALQMAQKNTQLNRLSTRHKVLAGDAFECMEKLHKSNARFDLIIVDPPSFAKKAEENQRAIKSYGRLTSHAARLISQDGVLVMASCSSRVSKEEFFAKVEATLQEEGYVYEIIEKSDHDIDHPIKISEAAYLKCGYYKIRYRKIPNFHPLITNETKYE